MEAYAPTDNVSELTARTNDEGWATVFSKWLEVSRLSANDLLLVFSVGGGNVEKNVSPNLVAALKFAKEVGAKVMVLLAAMAAILRKWQMLVSSFLHQTLKIPRRMRKHFKGCLALISFTS